MRKITARALGAFVTGVSMSAGNMSVFRERHGAAMFLHGNLIAERFGHGPDCDVYIFDADWQTPTTKDRLNAVLEHYGAPRIHQRAFVWHLGSGDWHGCARLRIRDGALVGIDSTSTESGYADAQEARRWVA